VHFWGLTTEKLSLIPLVSLVGLLCSIAVMPVATRLFDKKGAVIFPAAVVIITTNILVVLRLLEVPWFPGNDSPLILPLVMTTSFIAALLAPVVFATINSMFADIADEHELESGHRREGVIFSARSFVIKTTGALGIFIGGMILDLIAFPRGAAAGTVPADIVWNLGFIQGPATSIFTLIGLVLYLGYRLDRKRHAEIMAELEARRRAAAQSTERAA
jgi:Na+/melibiose symporter-like transporter